jgi:hypothetical protein
MAKQLWIVRLSAITSMGFKGMMESCPAAKLKFNEKSSKEQDMSGENLLESQEAPFVERVSLSLRNVEN